MPLSVKVRLTAGDARKARFRAAASDWRKWWHVPVPRGCRPLGVCEHDGRRGALFAVTDARGFRSYALGRFARIYPLPQGDAFMAVHLAMIGSMGGKRGTGAAKARPQGQASRAPANPSHPDTEQPVAAFPTRV